MAPPAESAEVEPPPSPLEEEALAAPELEAEPAGLSIVDWHARQQRSLSRRAAAARYGEKHQLTQLFGRLAKELAAANPGDPAAFLRRRLQRAGSLAEIAQCTDPPAKPVLIDSILSDSEARYWVEALPEVWKAKCALPYTDEEIAEAAAACNCSAAPPDRKPKLIFQLGAAGTGKSTRMADCYETLGVTPGSLVVADGDNVREAHKGVSEAFALTKKTLIEGMKAAESPELEQYSKELEPFVDEHPVGFKDSEHWCYNNSGEYKDRFASEALAAKKDVVMGITKEAHMTKKYKSVIDDAVAAGYEVSAMATFVVPEVLVTRQIGRGKRKGRLVQTHPDCKDGDLVENARLKQQMSIDALPYLSELVKQNNGTLMLFDNTPDYFADPESKQGPFYVQQGGETSVSYNGPATPEGMMEHVHKAIQ